MPHLDRRRVRRVRRAIPVYFFGHPEVSPKSAAQKNILDFTRRIRRPDAESCCIWASRSAGRGYWRRENVTRVFSQQRSFAGARSDDRSVPTTAPRSIKVSDVLRPITGFATLNGLLLRLARINILYRPISQAHFLLSLDRFDYHRISIWKVLGGIC